MASKDNIGYADLVQLASCSERVSTLIDRLKSYFKIESFPERSGHIVIDCSLEYQTVLQEIKEEFRKDFKRSEEINANVRAIVPRPETTYFLSRGAQLLLFQTGVVQLVEIIGKDDCAILMPVIVAGADDAMLEEMVTKRQTTVSFKIGFQLMIAGKCKVQMQPQSRVLCVVLCIGKDKV